MHLRQHALLWGIAGACAALLFLAGGVAVGMVSAYEGRILPRVSLGGVDVGGLTREGAEQRVREKVSDLLNERIHLQVEGSSAPAPRFTDLGVHVPVEDLVAGVARFGHTSDPARDSVAWARALFGTSFPLRFEVRETVVRSYAQEAFAGLIVPPRSAWWRLAGDGAPTLVPASDGKTVNEQQLARDVLERLRSSDRRPIAVRLTRETPAVSDAEARVLLPSVERMAATPLALTLDERLWEVPSRILRSWIALERRSGSPVATLASEPVAAYLTEVIGKEVNRPAADARFEISEGRVSVFSPPQEGVRIKTDESVAAARAAAEQGSGRAELEVERTSPAVATTDDLERLGIRDLLGRGESDFRGSPKNRIHNIRVGAARFHGVLIPPRQEFGFNEQLGPVRKDTGYLPELVILTNVTTPQYGGGLCQVSTTAFRAAVLSGLKITERRNHAYPVSYYGTPGFDATIYPNQRTWKDGTDLKFLNDTPAHILVQTRLEGTKLIFEFWGTSDGRDVKLVGPTPYDRKSGGAVKARLVQQVYRGGELAREETFESSYKSPKLFPRVLDANAEGETWEERVRRIAEKDRKAREEAEKQVQRERVLPLPTPTPVPVIVEEE